jgi:hypothetical protein
MTTTSDRKLPDGTIPYQDVRCASCGSSIYADREARAWIIGLALVALLAVAGWWAAFG